MHISKDLVLSSESHCSPRDTSQHLIKPVLRLTKKVTRLKSQEALLNNHGEKDIFSSIRPKVGKTFLNPVYEDEINRILKEARNKIVDVGKKEKTDELRQAKYELSQCYENAQVLPEYEFRSLCKRAKKIEISLSQNLQRESRRKIRVYREKRKLPISIAENESQIIPEKRRRHHKTRRKEKKLYDKKKRKERQNERRIKVQEEINIIKESNLVKNFSSEETIPDEVYLYLSLGSTFSSTVPPKKHDYVFDTKEFCRKLAWSAFHAEKKEKQTEVGDGHRSINEDTGDLRKFFENDDDEEDFLGFTADKNSENGQSWSVPKKLKIKSRRLPDFKDNLLAHVTEKIKNAVNNIEMPKKHKRNLTLLEAKGQKWCRKMISERRLYITRVDKGGCIIILDASTVDELMQDALNDINSFVKLDDDPRGGIKKKIKAAVCSYADKDLLSPEDVFAITGITKKRGMSHGHEFVVKKPHMYLLFKIHKLNQEKIQNKVIPPTRMVTSGVGGPTFRLGTFLDNLLKPVVNDYCKGEVLKDSTDFLVELNEMEKAGHTERMKFIGTLDVDALYPSIRLELAIAALRNALDTVTKYTEAQKDMIISLVKLCIENSVIHYRGSWYRSILGLPTGGPESGSCANIVVFYVLEKILLVHPSIAPHNMMALRKRFLDDIWFAWYGTNLEFAHFKAVLNEVGDQHGITFKGEVGASIDFLDVSVTLNDSHFTTKMYVKPTDASRYLHRRSDHAAHTFKSIPYTQFRRAVLLCSEQKQKMECIEYIAEKLRNSGYKTAEIEDAKKRALSLKRCDLMQRKKNFIVPDEKDE